MTLLDAVLQDHESDDDYEHLPKLSLDEQLAANIVSMERHKFVQENLQRAWESERRALEALHKRVVAEERLKEYEVNIRKRQKMLSSAPHPSLPLYYEWKEKEMQKCSNCLEKRMRTDDRKSRTGNAKAAKKDQSEFDMFLEFLEGDLK